MLPADDGKRRTIANCPPKAAGRKIIYCRARRLRRSADCRAANPVAVRIAKSSADTVWRSARLRCDLFHVSIPPSAKMVSHFQLQMRFQHSLVIELQANHLSANGLCRLCRSIESYLAWKRFYRRSAQSEFPGWNSGLIALVIQSSSIRG